MCFRAVKYLPPRQSYWLYLIHPLSCLPPIYIDYSSMSWLRSKMAAALPQWRCYSLIAIWDFSLCGALGLLCLWQMLSYVHELSYKPMMCFSPSSPLRYGYESYDDRAKTEDPYKQTLIWYQRIGHSTCPGGVNLTCTLRVIPIIKPQQYYLLIARACCLGEVGEWSGVFYL